VQKEIFRIASHLRPKAFHECTMAQRALMVRTLREKYSYEENPIGTHGFIETHP
jgi:hypothetical protein